MALKVIILFATLVAASQASSFFDDDWNTKVPSMKFQFPRMQNFYIPQIPMFSIPMPAVPSVGDIKNTEPKPGQVFNGMAIASTSGFTKDKDGNVIRTGGTSALSNNNGVVKEYSTGNAPPNVNDPNYIQIPVFEPIKMPSFSDDSHEFSTFTDFTSKGFEDSDFPNSKAKAKKMKKKYHDKKKFKFSDPDFSDIKFPAFKPIPTINPEEIKNYKPKEGEHYVAYSESSVSHSSDINGVKSSGGATSTVLNVDGDVKQKSVLAGTQDDPTTDDS